MSSTADMYSVRKPGDIAPSLVIFSLFQDSSLYAMAPAAYEAQEQRACLDCFLMPGSSRGLVQGGVQRIKGVDSFRVPPRTSTVPHLAFQS